MEGINIPLVAIVIVLTAALAIVGSSTINTIEDLKADIETKDSSIDYLKDTINNQQEVLINLPECPPATVIWNNNTEYIYETIWNNDTIYVDNAIFDVNRDGQVDYYDTCEVLWYIKHGLSFAENMVFNKYGNPYDKLYDVNRDGNVNTSDIDMIWQYCDVYP